MIKYKTFKQTTNLCGPASLKTVFDFQGIIKLEKEWQELSGASGEDGVVMEGLIKAVNAVGYKSQYLKESSIETLRELLANNEYVIVNWWSADCGHYCPVVDVTEKEIVLADVEQGEYRTMDLTTFELNWFELENYPAKTKCDLLLREVLVIRPK